MTDAFVFTADTNIAAALELGPQVVETFRKLGLACAGRTPKREWCVAAEKETLGDAALYHECDLDAILRALNALRVPADKPRAEPAP